MIEKKARLSDEAGQAIEDMCRIEGISFSAMLEAIGLLLARAKDPETGTFPHLADDSPYYGIVELARSIQGERRSRKV